MKSEQVVVTVNGRPYNFYIGAVPGHNKITNKPGFLVYWFTGKEGVPTDNSKGKLLADILFATEKLALKEGAKILKAKIKADVARQRR